MTSYDCIPHVPKKRKLPASAALNDILEHIRIQEDPNDRKWPGRNVKMLKLPLAYFLEPQGIKDITWVGPIRWLLQYLRCPPYIPRSRWLNWLNHGATPAAYLIDDIVAHNGLNPQVALQYMNWDTIKMRARGPLYKTPATCFTLVAHNLSVIRRTEEDYRHLHKDDPNIDQVMDKRAADRLKASMTKMWEQQESDEDSMAREPEMRFRIDGRTTQVLNPLHPLDPRNAHNLTAFEDIKYAKRTGKVPLTRIPRFGPLIPL